MLPRADWLAASAFCVAAGSASSSPLSLTRALPAFRPSHRCTRRAWVLHLRALTEWPRSCTPLWCRSFRCPSRSRRPRLPWLRRPRHGACCKRAASAPALRALPPGGAGFGRADARSAASALPCRLGPSRARACNGRSANRALPARLRRPLTRRSVLLPSRGVLTLRRKQVGRLDVGAGVRRRPARRPCRRGRGACRGYRDLCAGRAAARRAGAPPLRSNGCRRAAPSLLRLSRAAPPRAQAAAAPALGASASAVTEAPAAAARKARLLCCDAVRPRLGRLTCDPPLAGAAASACAQAVRRACDCQARGCCRVCSWLGGGCGEGQSAAPEERIRTFPPAQPSDALQLSRAVLTRNGLIAGSFLRRPPR